MKIKLIIILLLSLIACSQEGIIKIGIITDLTGPASYWGESTQEGAEVALKELREEGYNVELIFEDFQLDTKKALTSAQRLLLEDVDAIYAEFNPAAVAVGSLLKDLISF